MTTLTWLRPALFGSALGLLTLSGCFGPGNDKGDNVNAGKPLPHDGTTTDDFSRPRREPGTLEPTKPPTKTNEPEAPRAGDTGAK